MAAETSARPSTPLRSAGWALACGLLTSGAVFGMHWLEVRDRPELPPILPDHPTRVDAYGDPMPVGAVARLGSRRFRVGAGGVRLEILPDGKRFVAGLPDQRIGVFDIETGRRLRVFEGARRWSLKPGSRPVHLAPWTDGLGSPSIWFHRRLLALGAAMRGAETLWVEGDHSADGYAPEVLLALDVESGRVSRRDAEPFPLTGDTSAGNAYVLDPRWWRRESTELAERFESAIEFRWTRSPDRRRAAVQVRMRNDDGLEDWPFENPWTGKGLFAVGIRDQTTGEISGLEVAHRRSRQFAWSGDARLWLVAPGRAEVLDPETGAIVATLTSCIQTPSGLAMYLVPERGVVVVRDRAIALPDGLRRRWRDRETFKRDTAFRDIGRSAPIVDVVGRADGDTLRVASLTRDGDVRVWSFGPDGPLVAGAAGHREAISDLVWHPTEPVLAGLDRAGRIGLWDATTGERRWMVAARLPLWRPLGSPGGFVEFETGEAFEFTDAGRTVAVRYAPWIGDAETRHEPISEELVTEAWSVSTGEPVEMAASEPIVGTQRYGIDGRPDERIELELHDDVRWRQPPNGGAPIMVTLPGPALVRCARPHVQRVQESWWTPVVLERYAWSLKRQLERAASGLPPVLNVARRPGKQVAVVYAEMTRARLVDLASGEILFTFPPDEGVLTMARWSPDGDLLATGANDGSILIWDVDEMIAAGARYR